MKKFLCMLLALGAVASAPAFASADLAKAKNCMACHSVDKKVIGPAFRDVAAKYAGQKGMDSKLAAKIVKGGGGVWGPMEMPPNAIVSAPEALVLAKWVLTQK